ACILQPEVTEGPYYLDVNKVRSDITEGRPGIPLALKLVVVDAAGCLPIKDAVVDVWHCDAGGDYSGVSGVAGTFLRGTQVSDGAGVVQFNTIFPGWYRGRAVHIHLKVHVGGSVVHTGQLFFDDAVLAAVSTRAPYSSRGAPDQSNSSDSIFRQSGGSKAIVPVTEQGSGYAGAITLGVQGGQGIQ
ncbi:MAG TPA: intradiol ring-cleavage dioxygenase, partial [Acidimicrobiales bacterium]|nr:intradiol ring-cleavage dioxygenase [Acidimicrobiales bacterium]